MKTVTLTDAKASTLFNSQNVTLYEFNMAKKYIP